MPNRFYYALQQIKGKYPYFVVCDADGILPSNFIKELLPYFYEDERIAFVQASQAKNPQQKGFFANALGVMICAHYRYYVKARNRFGFVMFYGHGEILRTDVWEKVGGFPEIATEDLAYAARVRELGYQGIFTDAGSLR